MTAQLSMPADPADEWTPHFGHQDCPVSPATLVIVRYRNGRVSPIIAAKTRRWRVAAAGASAFDIAAWKLAPFQDGEGGA